jgi:hypothetical protein
MSKQFYVYVHCLPSGEPFYVGKWCDGKSFEFTSNRNKHHINISNKYGKANIVIHKYYCTSEQAAFYFEVELIAYFKGEGFVLANATDGGEGPSGHKFSESEKLNLSKIQKSIPKDWMIGNKHALGYTRSEETKRKLSCAAKLQMSKLSPQERINRLSKSQRNSISKANSNRVWSAESRQRLSQSIKQWHQNRGV